MSSPCAVWQKGKLMYRAKDIARYIINYSNKTGYCISNLKLQCLLYFVQAYFLIMEETPCFDDKMRAEDYGPVVPEVYGQYKEYGHSQLPPVTSYLECTDNGLWHMERNAFDSGFLTKRHKELIEEVVDEFSGCIASELIGLIQEQKPWKEAREQMMPIFSVNTLKKYFRS